MAYCLLNDDSWQKRADSGYDLIIDGLRPAGHLFGRDNLIPLMAQQHHFILQTNTCNISGVYHDYIHADPSPYRSSLSPDQDIAKVGNITIVTVKLTDRQYGNSGIGSRSISTAIPDKRSFGHFFDLGDFGFPGQSRF